MTRKIKNPCPHVVVFLSLCAFEAASAQAQMAKTTASLPDAPQMRLMAQAGQSNPPMQPNAAQRNAGAAPPAPFLS